MMNIVRMYGLDSKKELQTIGIPKEARILSVCVVHEEIKVAVEEDVNAHLFRDCYKTIEFAVFKAARKFYVDSYNFLGTIVLDFGNTIYHVLYRNV